MFFFNIFSVEKKATEDFITEQQKCVVDPHSLKTSRPNHGLTDVWHCLERGAMTFIRVSGTVYTVNISVPFWKLKACANKAVPHTFDEMREV